MKPNNYLRNLHLGWILYILSCLCFILAENSLKGATEVAGLFLLVAALLYTLPSVIGDPQR